MKPTVVVGYDQSAAAKQAVVEAAHEAMLSDASLVIVHVFHWVTPASPIMFTPPNLEESCREAAKLIVAEAPALVHERYPSVPVETRAIAGYAPEVLTSAARDAELLVLGNRGRGGFAGLMLGSVSMRGIAEATCPVIVVHAGEHKPTGSVLAAVDLEADGVDDVLGFAFAEAARRRSAVRAVYVRDRPWHLEYATDIEVVDVTFARATEEAGRQLAAILASWQAKHPEVPATHEVLVAPPGAALVEQARNADLAVVGAMRRAGAHHGLRVGPVAHTVLLHADCPVAVVPMELKAGA